MTLHWNVGKDFLEITEMPFYWRMSDTPNSVRGISPRMPIRVVADARFDYLRYDVTESQWDVIDKAYKQNENIGFLNENSGQLHTYGSSVNNFFLESITKFEPKNIYEIGCGAGFSIRFLKENGCHVVGNTSGN